jgi:hypothetical protein
MGGTQMEQKSIDLQEVDYKLQIKQDIDELQQQLQQLDTVYEPPTNHHFVDGMYCREMFALKGTMIIGATHKKPCFNLLTEGTILVSNGSEEVVLKAPQTFIGADGVQKIGYALTDVVWVNVFRTDATTVEEAELELFEEDIYKIGSTDEWSINSSSSLQ